MHMNVCVVVGGAVALIFVSILCVHVGRMSLCVHVYGVWKFLCLSHIYIYIYIRCVSVWSACGG